MKSDFISVSAIVKSTVDYFPVDCAFPFSLFTEHKQQLCNGCKNRQLEQGADHQR